ncbi:TRAP transporter small permease [Georgenia sp. AZ-5]|uniref:TRAP transporter small permease n=1 Tax=Georgenia sp. AZ-5 TaxID=3367526 RepID=UPI0037552B77
MRKVKETLDSVLTWFCVVLFGVLVLDVTWQVFTRLVLDQPSGWSEELAKYLFIWLGLFGAALVFGERGHIAVDFVISKFPDGLARVVALAMQFAILAFAVLVLVYGGWRVSQLTWNQNLTGLPVNVGWLYLALPVSGVLVAFYTLYHLVAISTRAESAVEDVEPDVI